jgi:hypothetical protein
MMVTNQYSCLLDSFAFVLGVKAEHLTHIIGHSGSGENEPRGFHSQEIIDALNLYGLKIMPIELFPRRKDPETGDMSVVEFPGVSHRERFAHYLDNSRGVLYGFNRKDKPHAAAWLEDQVHDPNHFHPYEIIKRENGKPIDIYLNQPLRPIMFWMLYE